MTPLETLRETAEKFNNMGSVASMQSNLLEITEALEKEHITQQDLDFEVSKWLEKLDEEKVVSSGFETENTELRSDLQKAKSLNEVYEKETLEEFKVRLKTRTAGN